MTVPTMRGRDQELSALDAVLTGVHTGRHTLAIVRGADGIGRTTLLAELERRWRARDVRVLRIAFGHAVPRWDEFGATAVRNAVRERFEEFGDGRLATAVETVGRLCRPVTYQSRSGRSGLLIALTRLFALIAEHQPIALLADDVDALPCPSLALAPLLHPGYVVVATRTDTGGYPPEAMKLDAIADHVLTLGPLPDDCLRRVLADLTGSEPEEHLASALRTALGPLSRHPGALVSTVDALRQDGRLVAVHGRTCIAGGGPIALPGEHGLVGRVGSLGATGRDLVILSATCVRFGIDDLPALAAISGRTIDDCGHTVDRLVRLGALDCADDGRLTCPCPALAERIVADRGPHAARLHRAVAEHLLAGPERPGDGTGLTDHIALAGTRLRVTPGHGRRLIAHAGRIAGTDPERALIWCRAALHHLARDERRPVLLELARLSLHTGDYAGLLALADTEQLDAGLAAAVTVAAIHLTCAVPDAARAVLPAAAEFRDRWRCGDPVDIYALLSWCAAIAEPGAPTWTDGLVEAASAGDLAEVLRVTFGCALAGTPLSLYHHVIDGYRTGDWPGALSAARRLELTGCQDRALLSVARLHAAEICAERSHTRQALAWMAAAGTGERGTALRGWVDSGMRWRAGGHARAFDDGWHAYQRAAGLSPMPGRNRLLARLAVIAVDGGLRERADRVLAEVVGLRRSADSSTLRQLLLFVRGMVERDPVAATASAELARRRGHQPELLAACLLAGELSVVARPWLHEAHGIAKRLGTGWRNRLRRLMRARGVDVPGHPLRSMPLSDNDSRGTGPIPDGHVNQQIAAVSRMSDQEVEDHLSLLIDKAGARTRVGLSAAPAKG